MQCLQLKGLPQFIEEKLKKAHQVKYNLKLESCAKKNAPKKLKFQWARRKLNLNPISKGEACLQGLLSDFEKKGFDLSGLCTDLSNHLQQVKKSKDSLVPYSDADALFEDLPEEINQIFKQFIIDQIDSDLGFDKTWKEFEYFSLTKCMTQELGFLIFGARLPRKYL